MTSWADVRETHTAALFFAGDRVVKVKKPVDLGFVDLTSRAARAAACAEEVRLNRRLSPDVYLGVAELAMPDGTVEPAVEMRRLPDDRTLTARVLAADADVAADLDRLADRLAVFHRTCPVVGLDLADDAFTPVPLLWQDNLSQLRRMGAPQVPVDLVDEVAWLAHRYAAGRRELLDERTRNGLVRDGHGDLLADDVFLLPDGPRVLDCLEFDPRLRIGDVLLDAAFLAMDLERLGRPDLAVRFLRRYAATAGETHPPTLEHYYVAYRATVRAKVAAVRAQQGDPTATDDVTSLLRLAKRHLDAARVRVVLVGGLPGAGKSTLAADLAQRIPAVHLSSDRMRWHLMPDGPAYDDASTDRVYAALVDGAAAAVAHGQHVVIDASWSSAAYRAAARTMAATGSADLLEVQVTVDDDVASQRLAQRDRARGASEADVAVRRDMERRFAGWPQAVTVDTSAGRTDVSMLLTVPE